MRALSAMGVVTENLTLPAVVGCPTCQQNTLHLFDDPTTDGLWLHCNSCNAHGDIITFAASTWNTSVSETLQKFADLDLINQGEKDNIVGEYERCLNRYREAEGFWYDAESQIWSHGDDIIACRVRELGVYQEVDAAGLIGVAHPEQIEKFCKFVWRAKPTSVRHGGTSLVLPYYDLPGRLTGFLLVQYDKEFQAKQSFIPLTGYRRRRPEAGYFLLKTALLPTDPSFKNTQFIVDDPLWALVLQCETLRTGGKLLPLMASYSGTEANSYGRSWSAFNHTTRIFQAQTASPELISRVCAARGYLALMSQTKRLAKRLHTEALSRVIAMRTNAETWQAGLTKILTGMNEIAAQSFASRLTIPPDKLAPFLQKVNESFSPGFADRVLASIRVLPAADAPKTAWRWLITPRSDGWWSVTNQRVCSANIVINKIIQSDSGEKSYSGTIYLDGESFPFSGDAAKIERMGLLEYAAAYLSTYKKLIVFDGTWNRRSLLIAIGLSKPELIAVSSRLGWDERANAFRFANYALCSDGTIELNEHVSPQHRAIVFPEPVAVAPPTIQPLLTPSPENAFTWTVFAAIAANLIDPILRRDTTATAITSELFPAALKVGAALGCEHMRSAYLRRSEVSKQFYDKTDELVWPAFLSNAFDDASLGPIVPKCHNRPVFARLAEPASNVAPSYSWQVIRGAATEQTDVSALRYVLPAYIQHALKTRMGLSLIKPATTAAVLEDLHGWLARSYGKTFQFDYALRHLITRDTADIAFALELRNAITAGKLAVLPQPRKRKQPPNYLIRKKEVWWLNQRAIDRYFYSCKSLPPNWLMIIELLTKNGLFVGEEAVHNLPGILVTASWCDQYLLPVSNLAREIG